MRFSRERDGNAEAPRAARRMILFRRREGVKADSDECESTLIRILRRQRHTERAGRGLRYTTRTIRGRDAVLWGRAACSFAASSAMRNARTRITHGSSWLLRSIVRPLEPPPPRPHFTPGFFFAARSIHCGFRSAVLTTSRVTFMGGQLVARNLSTLE